MTWPSASHTSELRDLFLPRALEHADLARTLADALEDISARPGAIEELRYIAHQDRGAAPMVGLIDVADAATELETCTRTGSDWRLAQDAALVFAKTLDRAIRQIEDADAR